MSNKKRGLGRGLSALIGDNPSLVKDLEKGDRQIEDIDIENIIANENQPRKVFNKESLEELSESIKIHGIIQPIVLRKIEKDKYQIVAGERRFRASKLADIDSIPSIIMDIDDEEAAKLALIENIQRKDLNPIEEAEGFKLLIDEYNLTQRELAKVMGKSRSYIGNALRLLNLDKDILSYIEDEKISMGHGKALLAIKDKDKRSEVAKDIMDKKLSVRHIEGLSRELTEEDLGKKETKAKEDKKVKSKKKDKKNIEIEETSLMDAHIKSVEEDLMSALGTRVRLISGSKSDKIEIEYYTDEDLERIYEIIME